MKILKWLDDYFEEFLGVGILVIITIIMFAQIIMRYCFNSGFTWAEELCRYLFACSIFIGAGYCVKKNIMFRMDFINEKLSEKARCILEIIIDISLIVFFAFWTYNGFIVIERGINNKLFSAALKLPFYVIYIIMTFGMLGGTLRSIQKLFIDLMDYKKNNSVEKDSCSEEVLS